MNYLSFLNFLRNTLDLYSNHSYIRIATKTCAFILTLEKDFTMITKLVMLATISLASAAMASTINDDTKNIITKTLNDNRPTSYAAKRLTNYAEPLPPAPEPHKIEGMCGPQVSLDYNEQKESTLHLVLKARESTSTKNDAESTQG